LGCFALGAFIAGLCGSLHRARDEAETIAGQLHASQGRYQSIVETASEGIWTVDTQLNTTFANARMAELLGTTPDAMMGRPISDFLFEADRDIPAQTLAAGELDNPHESERRYRHTDGSEVWFMVNATPIRDDKGQFNGVLALHTDITERRRSNAALNESHERFELASRAVTGYVYEWDIKSQTVWRSDGFEEFMGYSPSQVQPTIEWWRELIHPDDREYAERQVEEFLAGKESFSMEYRARHADGSFRWVWERGLVMRSADRRNRDRRADERESEDRRADKRAPVRVVGSVSDISARKGMEVALRESDAAQRQLADSMPQIVWSSNPRGVPYYMNRRWFDYSGQSPEFDGRDRWEEFYHPDDIGTARQLWEKSTATGETFRLEARLRDRNGHYRWFLCRAVAVRDSQSSEITRWIGTATDIDDQKRAADAQKFLSDAGAILSSSLNYETTLERVARLSVPVLGDWCFVVLKARAAPPKSSRRRTSRANKCRLSGKDTANTALNPQATRGFAQVMRTGQPELAAQLKEEVWGDVVSPQYAAEAAKVGHHSTLIVPLQVGTRILGSIGFSYAQTDRKFSEKDIPLAQELARRAAIAIENASLYRELQQADKRKDEFLAMLAHELRNPLAAISAARALLDDLLEGEAQTVTATPRAILGRQISQLTRLVDDLLDVSRITRGKIELRRQPTDFAAIVHSALDGVRPLVFSRRHELHVEIGDDYCVHVDADPARLGQIVGNLVTNAAKYTDVGGQITVSLHKEGAEAILRVRDNGTGLTSEMLHSIWDLFAQSERTLDRAQGGLGIGLTLVRSLAEMHGGRVGAHSDGLGKGAEFLVALPILSGEMPISSGNNSAPLSVENATKNRVLVVDDNQDAARMLGAWLEGQGWETQIANDGAHGLEIARSWQPQVALIDIGMPVMDGYQVARHLRESSEYKTMLLIAVTGYGQPSDRDRALEAGFDFHLTKPVNMDELKRLIEI
jgi:PAS domain S-box-containing protein